MSDVDGAALLAATPLFAGVAREDLTEMARAMRRRAIAPGDVLWHQGAEALGMALIVAGRVAVTLRLPGGRTVTLADVGPGETIGELPLVDGGPHSATAEVTEAGELLFFSRPELAPLLAREDPWAFAVKRRFAAVTAGRLRRQLGVLADSLGPAEQRQAPLDPAATLAQLVEAPPPDPAYIRRMAAFRALDASEFLTTGRYVHCPRGTTLEEEGTAPAAFAFVINGNVERVLVRGDRRIRVGLAGPGQAFGYEGLIDGQASPATAVARERALLLILPRDGFADLFTGENAASSTFLDVINRDLAGWLRRAIRPQAHLAVRPIT